MQDNQESAKCCCLMPVHHDVDGELEITFPKHFTNTQKLMTVMSDIIYIQNAVHNKEVRTN